MKLRIGAGLGLLLAATLVASSDYLSARKKIEMIERDQLKAGSRVALTERELNALVVQEVPAVAPEGVRNPRVELGAGVATGTALIDFGKIRRAQGKPPGWLMARLLDGERPVRVTASVTSAGGQATVNVQQVEISGMSIEGPVLDYLIDNYLRPRYPTAKIGEPFRLGHRIERLEVGPEAVGVVIGR